MTIMKKALLAAAVTAASASAFAANCGFNEGRVSIVGNEFPAIQTVGAAAVACANGSATVETNLTKDHQKINLAGMSGNPAEYTSAIVANSSIVALMNEDVIRPLNDLIAAYGQDIPKKQLITIGGDVMAVAFMANAQHLVYRADILEKAGLTPPTSYEEMLSGAEKIRAMGILENPLGGAYAAGWNLAQEFTNMYLGHGGEFYQPGTAQVAVNNAQGVATLEMLKALSGYMNPDFLTHDSNLTSDEWTAGNVAMMNMWGSRTGNLLNPESSDAMVHTNTKVAGPLTVGGGSDAASTLWWDGWTVSKNISDADAKATFLALKAGTSTGILNDTTMGQAVWMIDGYTPAPVNEGVFAAIAAGTTPYPMLPYHGLLHTALGDNVADFLSGKESAEQTLMDIEAAYTAAAKEKGFL
ncbi:extracellular solute-binding protein [Litorivicinus lipolyticus]|uniref:Extracellular solute-binding protein n=1 Tax=Litorivicinus lipolyticus TaxID=418701 RepID=A0A5Q2Q713_9GAMM|nr:extracellular solute-binding protein [Litorivicinus lipolyticus]QGG80149.1 extracellular solute-binding protein [Litorivicinus lipolyticus]